MATITTDTYLDDGTARTAGELWTINGATLTIRTDSRWHIGAPAGMTGTFSQIYIDPSLGGMCFITGEFVRWMPFNSGTGTVPAIGTIITQGGVSGYLLGVWQDYTSAPTAVGAAMPATGWIKFREVTGGTFSAGALSGITASSTGPDVVGWIEVVADQGSNMTTGASALVTHKIRGNWFDLGTTSGAAGQVIQIPTNGGGSGTSVQAIQIETSPGSGLYEWYNVIPNNSTYYGTNAISTDIRSKFVFYNGNGSVIIGQNPATVSVGYVPASGCKIRCPNVFWRQAAAASRSANVALNATLTSRARKNVGVGVNIDFDKVMSDLYFTCSQAGSVSVSNSCFDAQITFTDSNKNVSLTNIANGGGSTNAIPQAFSVSSMSMAGVFAIDGMKLVSNTGTAVFGLTRTFDSVFNNLDLNYVENRSTFRQAFSSDLTSSNLTINNLKVVGGSIRLSGDNITVTNIDYCDRTDGSGTSSTGALYTLTITNLSNSKIDGLTIGKSGLLTMCHPYNGYVNGTDCLNVKIRNFGSPSSFLAHGANSTLWPNTIWNSGGANANITLQRVFAEQTRGAPIVNNSVLKKMLCESVYGRYASAMPYYPSDSLYKNVTSALPNSPTTYSGYNFGTGFSSSTAGWIQIQCAIPSALGEPYVTTSLTNSKSGFSGSGNLRLKSIGEYVIFEFPFWIKGHTSFQNATPFVTGTNTNNHSYQYAIDTGSGYGSWKTLSGSNLASETISATGFKIKFKITCTAASNTNNIQFLSITTNTTLSDQMANLYDLDTSTLSFTGLQPGSEVRCYVGSDPATAVEIGGVESTAGSTFSFTHSSGGSVGFIRIFALGYQPVTYDPFTFSSSDQTILVQQVVDRNYSNPA